MANPRYLMNGFCEYIKGAQLNDIGQRVFIDAVPDNIVDPSVVVYQTGQQVEDMFDVRPGIKCYTDILMVKVEIQRSVAAGGGLAGSGGQHIEVMNQLLDLLYNIFEMAHNVPWPAPGYDEGRAERTAPPDRTIYENKIVVSQPYLIFGTSDSVNMGNSGESSLPGVVQYRTAHIVG